jgi:hypothetical protein
MADKKNKQEKQEKQEKKVETEVLEETKDYAEIEYEKQTAMLS